MNSRRLLLLALALFGFACHSRWTEELMDAPPRVEVDGVTITLRGHASRDFMPGINPPDGSPLAVMVKLTSSNTTQPFPAEFFADSVWVLKSWNEIWSTGLDTLGHPWPDWVQEFWGFGGPKWKPGIRVTIVARLTAADGRTWLMRDPDVVIETTM